MNGLIILFSAKVTKNRKNTRRQNSRANFSGGELRGAAIFCILRRRTGKTAQACARRILWMPKSGIPHMPIGCSVGCALQIRQKRPAFLQIFDFQWTQRGMIPRPSDYESHFGVYCHLYALILILLSTCFVVFYDHVRKNGSLSFFIFFA